MARKQVKYPTQDSAGSLRDNWRYGWRPKLKFKKGLPVITWRLKK